MRRVSFPTFASHWSPITSSAMLRRKRPLAVTFDDIPVVLFRAGDGRVQALVDRCPHRSVKLSLGRLKDDGSLQCAFHGWSFTGDGHCKAIPLNPGAPTGEVRAQEVAVIERGGLIWLSGARDARSPPELTVPATVDAAGWFGGATVRDWNCHWSRALQTMLDVAHIPFVHPRSIGAAFGRVLGKAGDAGLAHTLEKGPGERFRADWTLKSMDPAAPGDQGWVEFHPPNGMSLGIPQKKAGRQSLLHIWCTPLDQGRSRMIVLSRRNFGRYALVPNLYELLTPLILAEDRRNMESVWPSAVPDSGEVSMPSDAPTLAFQAYYRRAFLREPRAAFT